jgi:hypothetical protein
MARTIIEAVAKDALYNLNFTLKDYDGNPVNLTGTSALKLKAQKPGEAELAINGNMSVVSAAAGTCYYLVQANDFAAGIYEAEIEATYVNGQIITFADILIKVSGDLPK